MKRIVLTPNQVLKKKSVKVTKIDEKIKRVIKEIKKALLEAKDPIGVGLAAPQIGYLYQIFAIKPTEKSPISFFLNPKIIKLSKENISASTEKTPLEGCLSIPNIWGIVKRKKSVTLSFLNINGQQQQKTFTGFEAIIIQHEMDHLQGILFTEKVLEQGKKLYKIVKNEKGEEALEELSL